MGMAKRRGGISRLRRQILHQGPTISRPLLSLLHHTLNKQRFAVSECDCSQRAGAPDSDLQMCDLDRECDSFKTTTEGD